MDEHFSINVDEIRDKQRTRSNNRVKIYTKLLEKCYYRINAAANSDDTYCVYPIPDFILGMPTYNLAYCAAFIIHDLKNKGYIVKFFNPNVIFVSWKYEPPSFLTSPRKSITYNEPRMITDKPKNMQITLDKPKQNSFRSIKDYQPTGHFVYN